MQGSIYPARTVKMLVMPSGAWPLQYSDQLPLRSQLGRAPPATWATWRRDAVQDAMRIPTTRRMVCRGDSIVRSGDQVTQATHSTGKQAAQRSRTGQDRRQAKRHREDYFIVENGRKTQPDVKKARSQNQNPHLGGRGL